MLRVIEDPEVALSEAETTRDAVGVLYYRLSRPFGAGVDAFGFPYAADETEIAFERSDGATASLRLSERGEMVDFVVRAPLRGEIEAPPADRRIARLSAGEGGTIRREFGLRRVAGAPNAVAFVFEGAEIGGPPFQISRSAMVAADRKGAVAAIFFAGVERLPADDGALA